MIGSGETRSATIRQNLGHPVVDADGHWIETAPVMKGFFLDFVKDLGRPRAGRTLRNSGRARLRRHRASPLEPDERCRKGVRTLDHPAALVDAPRPRTLSTEPPPISLISSMSDWMTFGIDFAVLYPSRTLTTPAIKEAELRQIACRALNVYHAELYGGYGDRMTPTAMIPMHTPEEGIAELEHAVGEARPQGHHDQWSRPPPHRRMPARPTACSGQQPNWGAGSGERIDTLGLDSAYDYDPFWRRCVELKVAPASHTPGMGWGSRRSISSYVSNHIGSFGASMEALCRSLFLGGVTRRFPELSFGLLEGGVSWACELYAGLVSHWEKRNAQSIHQLDPARIDRALLLDLFDRYGNERMKKEGEAIRNGVSKSRTGTA